MNFTWPAVEGAQQALHRAWKAFADLGENSGQPDKKYVGRFMALVQEDLDTPKAIALLWELIKDEKLDPAIKRATILDFDRVLGIGFSLKQETRQVAAPQVVVDLPPLVRTLVMERDAARARKDFPESDRLRQRIEAEGYTLTDTPDGARVTKKLVV